jgi:ABC-type transport system involved in multi-copper enzyme maturation permease subunit
VSGALIVARYALREAIRRRVILVVVLLTVGFLALYALGTAVSFNEVDNSIPDGAPVDDRVLVGSTLFGLAMFTILFLGTVLGVFLTLGAVRGDAERGLLQPIVVRPVGRTSLLLGRYVGAALVCLAYVVTVYVAAMLITGITGGWWPDDPVGPGAGLVIAVLVIAALSLLGSVFLSSTANGIAVFMVFGAGLAAGLLGQIGDALSVQTLEDVAKVTSWILPFEALYQAGLHGLTQETGGVTGVIVQLGPFGGAQDAGPGLWAWALVYLGLVGAAARAGFARRDL